MMEQVQAVFSAQRQAREAELKLQSLRLRPSMGGDNGMTLTAEVSTELLERALHVIDDSGGTARE